MGVIATLSRSGNRPSCTAAHRKAVAKRRTPSWPSWRRQASSRLMSQGSPRLGRRRSSTRFRVRSTMRRPSCAWGSRSASQDWSSAPARRHRPMWHASSRRIGCSSRRTRPFSRRRARRAGEMSLNGWRSPGDGWPRSGAPIRNRWESGSSPATIGSWPARTAVDIARSRPLEY